MSIFYGNFFLGSDLNYYLVIICDTIMRITIVFLMKTKNIGIIMFKSVLLLVLIKIWLLDTVYAMHEVGSEPKNLGWIIDKQGPKSFSVKEEGGDVFYTIDPAVTNYLEGRLSRIKNNILKEYHELTLVTGKRVRLHAYQVTGPRLDHRYRGHDAEVADYINRLYNGYDRLFSERNCTTVFHEVSFEIPPFLDLVLCRYMRANLACATSFMFNSNERGPFQGNSKNIVSSFAEHGDSPELLTRQGQDAAMYYQENVRIMNMMKKYLLVFNRLKDEQCTGKLPVVQLRSIALDYMPFNGVELEYAVEQTVQQEQNSRLLEVCSLSQQSSLSLSTRTRIGTRKRAREE